TDRLPGDRLEPRHAGRLPGIGGELGPADVAQRLVPFVGHTVRLNRVDAPRPAGLGCRPWCGCGWPRRTMRGRWRSCTPTVGDASTAGPTPTRSSTGTWWRTAVRCGRAGWPNRATR